MDKNTRDKAIHSYYETNVVAIPLQVFEVFKDFFGEQYVDIQNLITEEEFKDCLARQIDTDFSSLSKLWKVILTDLPTINILIHFPKVTVSNEFGQHTDITHLYAKVRITYNGIMLGKFTLNRAEYTEIEYISNYLHSHVNGIPKGNFEAFEWPCLGQGPIKNTINKLRNELDLSLWQLFCLELSKYVATESISGGPYKKIENIGKPLKTKVPVTLRTINNLNIPGLDKNMLRKFTRHLILKKCLKFNYVNFRYSLGMPFGEYLLTITKEFISWYNEEYNNKTESLSKNQLLEADILKRLIVYNNELYINSGNISRNEIEAIRRNIGKKVCTFKDQDVTLNIISSPLLSSENSSLLLNPQIVSYILTIILKVLNYRYGRETNTDSQAHTNVWFL